ncbi:ComE operon protein 2 [Rossellomorea aquimaris]|uniref:ComE operon protein 2 n=1 Tax=Rossellomorea aquimaris TaxID=189382 RepID=UPI0007D06B0C|nr:ComE operon protein 2 [Rossellomorea aquimaris]
MERIAWHQYFMAQSHLLALRSTCTRLAVGATIVREKRIIAGGYNGSIAGGDHCIDEGCYVIDNHCVRTIHAEMNAVLQCSKFGVPTKNSDVYVTHFPCLQCCKALIQAGIKTVYYAKDYKNHPYALELFKQAEVQVEKVPFHENSLDSNFKEKSHLILELIQELRNQGENEEKIAHFENEYIRLFNDE